MKLGVVIVSYGHEAELGGSFFKELRSFLAAEDKIVVVDNKPPYAFREKVGTKYIDCLIEHKNGGFAAGCNVGVARIVDEVDIIVLMNPDVKPNKQAFEAVRAFNTKQYAACMPLITLPNGTINSAGNVVHTSGLSWCDKMCQPPEAAKDIREVSVISGAFAAISVSWWKKLGGLDERYFMYYEDTDLSARIILLGGKIALLPTASVLHEYEFEKGEYKWLYIERNIPLYMIKTWPLSVIAVFLPQNLVVGLGLWALAILQRRLGLKIRSTLLFWQALPAFWRARRTLQKQRNLAGYEFARTLYPVIDTPQMGGIGANSLFRGLSRLYFELAIRLLRIFTRKAD